jgi:hypothetical protein
MPKKTTGRTLKSGDGVTFASDALAATLDSTENEVREANAAKTAARLAAVRAKRESLAAGDAVPDDKRVV